MNKDVFYVKSCIAYNSVCMLCAHVAQNELYSIALNVAYF